MKDRRQGTSFTGFPAIGYDDEKGAQLGAVVQWFDNGSLDDPYFFSTPYRENIGLGVVGGRDNAEVRWSFLEFFAWTQHLRLGATAFLDAGRVFDDVGWSFEDWKTGHGGGLMLAWNLSTIIRFDFAESDEDSIFYVELGHSF